MNRKKAEIGLRISEFEMPPMQDVLIVGKNAPIGPESARRMVDSLAPGQYSIFPVEHVSIEAFVIRRNLLNLLPQEQLIEVLLEEVGAINTESMITRAQVSIVVQTNRSVELT